MDDYKDIVVYWRDPYFKGSELKPEEFEDMEAFIITRSIGSLVHSNDERMVLAQSSYIDGEASELLVIHHSCVERVVELQEMLQS